MTTTRQMIILFLMGVTIISVPGIGYSGINREERSELKVTEQLYEKNTSADLGDSFGLVEAIHYGMLNNGSLQAAFYRWQGSVHQIGEAVSLPDPEVGYKTFIDEVETRVGPQKEMYSVSQMLPFPGKLSAKGDVATAVSRQNYADFRKARLTYLYELKNHYFEYWYLRKNILVTEKNMELLKRFEGVAQSKYKSGLGSNHDLLKVQVELGKLENELLTLHDYRSPVTAQLNAVLNRDTQLPIGWPEEIDHKIISLDESIVLAQFLENNPDLVKAAQRIEESKQKVWLARLDYLPNFMVGYDYIRVDERPVTMPGNGDDASAVMLRINVPLWFGKQKSQLEAAHSMEAATSSERNQLERDVASKIQNTLFKINNAERQIKLYRDALVPKAEQSLKASETAYSAGKVDFLNLIDSERTLLNFQLSYYRAIRDYEQRFAELEMMVGTNLLREGA